MTKVTYYDSFIPLAQNEIDIPEDATFFFCKSFQSCMTFQSTADHDSVETQVSMRTLAGYGITTDNQHQLKRVIYHISDSHAHLATCAHFLDTLTAQHTHTYAHAPFTLRWLCEPNASSSEKEPLVFTLVEHHYDAHARYQGKNILSGKHPWFWQDEATYNAENQQITYKKYILDAQLNTIKEQLYDSKDGMLLDESYYDE